jgi:hypothetical protein
LNTVTSVRVAGARRVHAIASLGCVLLSTAVFLCVPGVARAAGTPAPDPGQLFGVHPVQEGSTTLPGGHFNFALPPGRRIADGIVIENLSDHALDFHVYGADLATAAGGGLAPEQPGATMHEAGAWIVVATPVVTVDAHSQFIDGFTLSVPAGVSTGQHLGAVVAAADTGTTPEGNPIEARAALIVVVTVPGVARPSAALTPLTGSTATFGQVGYGITLSNTGNVLLTYAGSVGIEGGDGLRVATLTLIPTSSYVVPDGRVALTALWRGTGLRSGTYRAQATVVILDNGTAVATLTSQVMTLQLSAGIPILTLAALSLAVLVILLVTAWSVRRALQRRHASSGVRGAPGRHLSGVR